MSKHTPGPWDYWSGYNPFDKIEAQVTAEGGDIVIASYNHLIEQGEANAQLMAAAPDLLEALTRARDYLNNAKFLIRRELGEHHWLNGIEKGIQIADVAIAKARGES